jgi:hypothetical protein
MNLAPIPGIWLGVGDTIPCTGCVDSGDIADGSIQNADIAVNAVESTRILNASIQRYDLVDDIITSSKIANLSIGGSDLGNGIVTTEKIADGAVTVIKIGVLTVGAGNLADWSVTTNKIDPGAVITTKLADDAVTGTKIADGQVGSSKIATNAISSSKVLNGTLTAADMDPAGGVYAVKSGVYVESVVGYFPDHACSWVLVPCRDDNDLPLHGGYTFGSDRAFRIYQHYPEHWDSDADPATLKTYACNESSIAQDFTATIVCVAVPGP